MVRILWQWTLVASLCLSSTAFAGDLSCYGHQSTTNYFSCNISPWNSGNCVWWAAYKRPDLAAKRTGSGWSAGQWYDKFRALGFPVGSEPKAGAIVEFVTPGPEHVAYAEKVNADGSFDVSEMDAYDSDGFDPGVNYATYYPNGDGTYRRNSGSTRWTLKGFIYFKESCNPSKEKCALNKYGTIAWYPPVENCDQASQWFQLIYDGQNQVSRIETTTKDACPTACMMPR